MLHEDPFRMQMRFNLFFSFFMAFYLINPVRTLFLQEAFFSARFAEVCS